MIIAFFKDCHQCGQREGAKSNKKGYTAKWIDLLALCQHKYDDKIKGTACLHWTSTLYTHRSECRLIVLVQDLTEGRIDRLLSDNPPCYEVKITLFAIIAVSLF